MAFAATAPLLPSPFLSPVEFRTTLTGRPGVGSLRAPVLPSGSFQAAASLRNAPESIPRMIFRRKTLQMYEAAIARKAPSKTGPFEQGSGCVEQTHRPRKRTSAASARKRTVGKPILCIRWGCSTANARSLRTCARNRTRQPSPFRVPCRRQRSCGNIARATGADLGELAACLFRRRG